MKYDFTSIMERKGMDAIAVDNVGKHMWGNEPQPPEDGFDFVPMWVADMNFPTCPAVTEAIIKRAKHPAFGYFTPREEYFDATIRWQEEHHKTAGLTKEAIGYENGVHGCVTSAVQVLSQPGDCILLHRPFYLGFSEDIETIGRKSIYSDLKKDEDGIYRMDFEDMDAKIKKYRIHLVIFCSPHNPTGRVWERWELEKAMEIFEKNKCYVISDEIWADLTFSGHQHIPTQMVNEWARQHTIAAYAPSKTFNLAGMIGSYHIIYNPYLRDRIRTYGENTHYNSQNVLSMHAQIGAYSPQGYEWVEELRQVLEKNCRYACEFINQEIYGVDVTMPQGTYMIFLDCTEYCRETWKTLDDVINAGWDVGIGWQDGRHFGGNCHIRMNLALPLSQIEKVCMRMSEHVF